MLSNKTQIIVVSVAVIAGFVRLYLLSYKQYVTVYPAVTSSDAKLSTFLAIGILSARQNFEARSVVRDTWMNYVQHHRLMKSDVFLKFIVGNNACNVHPHQRLDVHSCDRAIWHRPTDTDNMPLVTSTILKEDIHNHKQILFDALNVSIKIRHPLILKRLGLHTAVELSKIPVTVMVFDDYRETVVLSARFSVQDKGIIKDNYRYQSVDPTLLPVDFEGSVRVKIGTVLKKGVLQEHASYVLDDFGGAIVANCLGEDGFKLNKKIQKCLPLASLHASLFDIDKFNSRVNMQTDMDVQWNNENEKISTKLLEEMLQHDDILLVNVTDTYRSLPHKLLAFHDWLNSNLEMEYVLKTDDDCFANVHEIYNALKIFPRSRNFWWSNFRDDWFVERVGKWAEKDYRSSVYPRFACGSGNVISSDVSQWLAVNKDTLKHYQGEDVSMGIWLATLGPAYLQDQAWKCDKNCDKNALVIPELLPDELQSKWNNYVKCGNPCHC